MISALEKHRVPYIPNCVDALTVLQEKSFEWHLIWDTVKQGKIYLAAH